MARASYEEVEVIEGPGDLFARITRRRAPTGFYQYSYQIARRYEVAGEQRATFWMNRAHAERLAAIAEKVAQRIEQLPRA